jgi:hypothetical protein
MIPRNLTVCVLLILFIQVVSIAQRKPPAGGRLAIVVEERLAALRATPQLNGQLVRRLGRKRQQSHARLDSARGSCFANAHW